MQRGSTAAGGRAGRGRGGPRRRRRSGTDERGPGTSASRAAASPHGAAARDLRRARAGGHRRERGQRRRWHHDLRVRRIRVHLLDALRHGAGHRGPRRRAGDERTARRLHRRGTHLARARAVLASDGRVRGRRTPRREPRARRLGVRGHRRGDADLRRLPVHLGPDLGRGDLQRRGARFLQARRAHLPAALTRVPRLPDLDGARGPRLEPGRVEHALAPLPHHPGVPVPRSRNHRDDHHAIHAAVPGGRSGRPWHWSRRVPSGADRHDRGLDLRQPHRDVDHHRHGRDDRRDRPTRVSGRSSESVGAGRGGERRVAVRARSARRVRCSRRRSFRSRPPTGSPRRWAPSARCRAGSARRRCSSGSSPRRS